MMFELHFSKEAKLELKALKENKGMLKQYKAVVAALKKLQQNPRYPSLQIHEFYSLYGPNGEKVFEAYAEQNTPAAYRVFSRYGPEKGVISIISIKPHP